MTDAEVLAVIPARVGSKGIPQKNLRFLNGKPLLYYQLRTATESRHITDVVVTSDDRGVLDYASRFPVHLRERPAELAADQITLDPVVFDATEYMEAQLQKRYDVVVTLQPTSPLLRVTTLDAALENVLANRVDTVVPVVDETHLYWREDHGRIVPDYEERLNRQWLPRTYRETGAFLVTRRAHVTRDSRMGEHMVALPLNPFEGLDIDTPMDWIVAESALRHLRIAFVVNGNDQVGLGHLYRALAVANRFVGHDVVFLTTGSDGHALALLEASGSPVVQTTNTGLLEAIDRTEATLVINDILDTEVAYIQGLRQRGVFVVNFEDLGPGAEEAHLVFNALYERSNPDPSHRFGSKYECLNDRFLLYPPIPFRENPQTLLLTFGGVDESDLTRTLLEEIPRILEATALTQVIAIVGPGYAHGADLAPVEAALQEFDVTVHRSVDNMPGLMQAADVAVTSNGRTVYELAAMAIPTISIAQNDRETLHLFARYAEGVRYLGMAASVDPETIVEAITELAGTVEVRRKMHVAQLASAEVLRGGTTRTTNEILGEYWRWRDAGDHPR